MMIGRTRSATSVRAFMTLAKTAILTQLIHEPSVISRFQYLAIGRHVYTQSNDEIKMYNTTTAMIR